MAALSFWEKANVPANKKGKKHILNNYQSVSFLTIWRKLFEKLYSIQIYCI